MPDPTLARRPRFSLLNLLLTTAVVAITCGLLVVKYRSDKELQSLRVEALWAKEETTRLKAGLGYFQVDDPKLIYFANMRQWNDGDDLLRLHLPLDRRYRVCVQVHDYQQGDGVPVYRDPGPNPFGRRPRLRASLELTPGYGTIRMRYFRNKRGELKVQLSFHSESLPSGETGSFNIRFETLDIPEEEPGQDWKIAEGDRKQRNQVVTFPASEACVLLKAAARRGIIDAPEDHGIMVWLEPIEGEPDTPRWWEREPAGGDSLDLDDDFFDAGNSLGPVDG